MIQIKEALKKQFNPTKETPAQALNVTPAIIASTIPTELANFDAMPDSAFIRLSIVKALYGISSSTVWRNCKAKKFPLPRKLSDRVTAWSVAEIRADLLAKAGA